MFVPSESASYDEAVELAAYATRLEPYAHELGATLGTARLDDDDDFDAKVALLVAERVPAVSFTFGCPPA